MGDGGCQKLALALRAKDCSTWSTPTPSLEYSLASFLKKFILPRRLIVSVHSNGFPVTSEAEEKSVGTAEFDVVAHHCQVHSNQFDGEGINNEFHFNCNCTAHGLDDPRFWKPVDQFRVQGRHGGTRIAVQSLDCRSRND